jgi:hypothetical protein
MRSRCDASALSSAISATGERENAMGEMRILNQMPWMRNPHGRTAQEGAISLTMMAGLRSYQIR